MHDAVTDGPYRKRPLLLPTRLRDVDPFGPGRVETVSLSAPLPARLTDEIFQLLDVGDGYLVDAGCTGIAAHLHPRPPRPLQDVPAMDLVKERVESSLGIGLGRPVKLALQGTDCVELIVDALGGTSRRALTSLSFSHKHGRSSGPSLSDGCVVRRIDRYYCRLRPSRLVAHFLALHRL